VTVRPQRRQTIILAAIAGVLALVIAGAWLLQWNATRGSEAGAYRVTVTRGDSTLGSFDVADLEKLGTKRVVMQGKPETGPTLLSVLKAAGVDEFSQVSIYGAGIRDSGFLRLKRSEIDGNVLLDIAIRGTTKVCGPNIAWDDRVRDVERIDAQ